ncbi:MAG: type II toxin-antitoxin system HicA family toxin [Dehalococcoidia bacterium]
MSNDLRGMLRNAAGQRRAEIAAALRDHGYRIARQGTHEIWTNGRGSIIPVPRRIRGVGTKRAIIRAMIAADAEDVDDD